MCSAESRKLQMTNWWTYSLKDGSCQQLLLGHTNDFFLIDNKKAFTLWLNVPKVTAYLHFGTLTEYSHEQADF